MSMAKHGKQSSRNSQESVLFNQYLQVDRNMMHRNTIRGHIAGRLMAYLRMLQMPELAPTLGNLGLAREEHGNSFQREARAL